MKKIFILFFAIILLTTAKNPLAQDVLKIAAVVNNKIISLYDLNMRTSMVIIFSGLRNIPEIRARMRPQILRTMIDEELKLQEAKRIKITVTDKEVDSSVRRMEKKIRLSKGGLKKDLAKKNVDISVLHKRIKADITWARSVGARYASKIVISDEEIDENISQIRNNEGKLEYQISNIFLPVENSEDQTQVLANANRMIKQIKSGAKFSTLAKNFSKGSNAINGGDIGWVRAGQLDPELDNVLKVLQPEQISQPIRTIEGFYILYLKGKRTAKKFGDPDPEDATINLQQLFVPIAINATTVDVKKAISLAYQTGQKAKDCADLEQAAKEIGSPLSGNLGNLKISALGLRQKKLINGLPLMKASKPYRAPEGIMVLMVCQRNEAKPLKLNISDQRKSIKAGLRQKQLEIFARQYIQELRRNAFLEFRL